MSPSGARPLGSAGSGSNAGSGRVALHSIASGALDSCQQRRLRTPPPRQPTPQPLTPGLNAQRATGAPSQAGRPARGRARTRPARHGLRLRLGAPLPRRRCRRRTRSAAASCQSLAGRGARVSSGDNPRAGMHRRDGARLWLSHAVGSRARVLREISLGRRSLRSAPKDRPEGGARGDLAARPQRSAGRAPRASSPRRPCPAARPAAPPAPQPRAPAARRRAGT